MPAAVVPAAVVPTAIMPAVPPISPATIAPAAIAPIPPGELKLPVAVLGSNGLDIGDGLANGSEACRYAGRVGGRGLRLQSGIARRARAEQQRDADQSCGQQFGKDLAVLTAQRHPPPLPITLNVLQVSDETVTAVKPGRRPAPRRAPV